MVTRRTAKRFDADALKTNFFAQSCIYTNGVKRWKTNLKNLIIQLTQTWTMELAFYVLFSVLLLNIGVPFDVRWFEEQSFDTREKLESKWFNLSILALYTAYYGISRINIISAVEVIRDSILYMEKSISNLLLGFISCFFHT